MNLAFDIILIIMAVFLVIAVLMQSGKSNRMSGTISGSSTDTFFGKTKGKTRDRMFSKLTTYVSVVFVLVVIVVYVLQKDTVLDYDDWFDKYYDGAVENINTTVPETTKAPEESTDDPEESSGDPAESTDESEESSGDPA